MDPTSQFVAEKLFTMKNRFNCTEAGSELCAPISTQGHKPCMSHRQIAFRGEICMHFPGGLESLNKPLVWVFPQVVICLDCGLAQFTVPEAELKVIQQNLSSS